MMHGQMGTYLGHWDEQSSPRTIILQRATRWAGVSTKPASELHAQMTSNT